MSTSTRATVPRRLRLSSGKLPKKELLKITEDLRRGAVVVFPTETVYGLGTSAFAPSGIRRIYRLKGRKWNKPLALLVSSLAAARPLVEKLPAEAFRLAKAFWPGPLTLILPASPLGRLVTGGLPRIGLRVPRHPVALGLLQALGLPLATTSVNRAGEKPATSGRAAAAVVGNGVDWLLDGGPCKVKEASSVIDLSNFPYTVIREGALGIKMLERALSKSA
jgi:L-threonylcarbamoyladenylate synthase